MAGHDIIVIGASAGGVVAIREVTERLPRDLAAAVFVVMHVPSDTPSILPEIINRTGAMPAIHPDDRQSIQNGTIYVAPSDHHLLLDTGVVRVTRGPKHNRHRPSADPLFRSAARAYGPRVIGVVLTGSLDDGTSGLDSIKRRGGIAVVQDPATALFPGMPSSAIHHVDVDHVVALKEIGPLLVRLVAEPPAPVPPTADPRLEEEFRKYVGEFADVERIGKPSPFACPDCHGVLWEVDESGVTQFHCRVGHSYSIEGLDSDQSQHLESNLWVAVRALEENASLRRRIADRLRSHNRRLADQVDRRAERSEGHAARLRELLRHEPPPVKAAGARPTP